MQYARIEMVFVRGGWSRSATCAGAVSGPVRGAIVDPTRLVVNQTLVPLKLARRLELGVPSGGDVSPISTGDATLSPKTTVYGATGSLGRVSRVWVDRATGQLTHILFRSGGGGFGKGPEYVIDASRIAMVSQAGIGLKPGADTLTVLPLFRPDTAIVSDARMALNNVLADPRARRAVKLHVEDGEVTLAGEVDTVEQAHLAEWAVTRIPGVRNVVMDLIAQEQLAHEVESRISQLGLPGQNGHIPVQVLSEHGIVYLEGSVPDAQWSKRVETAALGAAGARVVVSNLRVIGDAPDRGYGTGPLTRNR